MTTIFDNILRQGVAQGIAPARTRAARDWYRNQAGRVTGNITPSKAMRGADETQITSDMEYGLMYAFKYDPKMKKELPYYDTFPLIFPIRFEQDGFLGINFHYLPPILRAKLMDALYPNVTNRKFDATTRMKVSYAILQAASKYRYFKPTIKKYLRTHVRSQFLQIDATQWDIALFLPTESFRKSDTGRIWEDSRKKIGR
jgi:hypothetical protein